MCTSDQVLGRVHVLVHLPYKNRVRERTGKPITAIEKDNCHMGLYLSLSNCA